MEQYITWRQPQKVKDVYIDDKATAKITQQRIIPNEPTKGLKWNHKKIPHEFRRMWKRGKCRTKNTWQKQKVNSKMIDLNPNTS